MKRPYGPQAEDLLFLFPGNNLRVRVYERLGEGEVGGIGRRPADGASCDGRARLSQRRPDSDLPVEARHRTAVTSNFQETVCSRVWTLVNTSLRGHAAQGTLRDGGRAICGESAFW